MNSKNNQVDGLLQNALGVAKKLSSSSLDALNKVAQNQKKSQSSMQLPEQDDQMPNLSQQLLGRHYHTVNKVTGFIAPDLTDKFSDYVFEQLNYLSSNLASVDRILDEAGVQDLEQLTQDIDRSKRISDVLAAQNKWLASAQGALSGATGVIGSAVDVPASFILSLRSIYQIGRAYGFELTQDAEKDIVQFIFKHIDLNLMVQKQTLLMAIKALSNSIEKHDLNALQQLLGTNQDANALKQWLKDEQGEAKFDWLNHLPKLSVLSKFTPLASASLSAAYSWKLLEDVNQKAQDIFSHARTYMQQHQELNLSPLAAYEKSRAYFAAQQQVGELQLDQEFKLKDHATIAKVVIQKKHQELETAPEAQDQVEHGLKQLADKMVEPHKISQQQPALSSTAPDLAPDEFNQEPESTDQPLKNSQNEAQRLEQQSQA